MKRVLIITAALAVLSMHAAQASNTRAGAAAGATQVCTPASVQQTLGVAYAPATGTTNGHLMNFYIPQGPGCTNLPVLIYSEGSAWSSDNGRSFSATLWQRATAAGYAVIGMSIRSHSQVKFPGQWCDIKAGIRFVRQQAPTYGLDPNRIAIMGFSSGGWVAAMAGTSGGVPEPAEVSPGVPCHVGSINPEAVSDRVQAAIPLHPPTNFLAMHTACPSPHPGDEDYPDCANALMHDDATSPESSLMGCKDPATGAAVGIQECPLKVAKADPYLYATPDDPPFLIMHGAVDSLVAYNQGAILKNALREICHDVTMIKLPTQNHLPGPSAYLADPNMSVGRTVWIYSPTTCQVQVLTDTTTPVAPTATYETIIAWLDQKMPPGPTTAALRSFVARGDRHGVVLRWRTGSEARTFGFNVYRERAGKRVKLNKRLVFASGLVTGRNYSFLDRVRVPGKSRYWLQIIGLDSRSTWRGPITAAG